MLYKSVLLLQVRFIAKMQVYYKAVPAEQG